MKRSLVAPTASAAAILLALAAGCSSSSNSGGSASGGSSSGGSSSGKSYKMSFIQGVAGDGFYVTMGCGMQAEAKKLGNVTVNTQGPTKFDPTLQNPIIQSVTASKPDAILIAPDDVTASQTPVDAAMNAGIKVVLVDTTLKNPAGAVSQISSDNLAGGADAFTAIKQLVPGGGQVLVVNVQPGVSTTDQRTSGCAAGKVKIVGFDAEPDEITALQQGTVQALIAQSPYTIGTNAVDQAVAALSGKPTTKKIGTKFTIITKANLNSAASQAAIYKTSC
jgi:ABC-type sugar transport system substrate-binding protein